MKCVSKKGSRDPRSPTSPPSVGVLSVAFVALRSCLTAEFGISGVEFSGLAFIIVIDYLVSYNLFYSLQTLQD
jgi:hypothetical protein